MQMDGLFNRRYLRVKVMQAVYAFDSANSNLEEGDKALMNSLNHVYDLYILMLSLLNEVVEFERRSIELKKEKRLATQEDLNPNTRFSQNGVTTILENNKRFKALSEKINWEVESDNIKKIWRDVTADERYEKYMTNERHNFQHDIEFMIYIFKNYIAVNDVILDLFEDRNMHWYDDVQIVSINVVQTISNLRPTHIPEDQILRKLLKNEADDKKFTRELYHKTILQSDGHMEYISKYTKNWEVDRIAKLDTVIMKIAITEFLNFPSIPVKVTINEYLEIAKSYSTEKSKVFINGVLDKVLVELKSENLIKKSGMGLINR